MCDDEDEGDEYELVFDEIGAWNLWLIMHMAKLYLEIGPPVEYQDRVLDSIENYQDQLVMASESVANKAVQFENDRLTRTRRHANRN